MRTNTLRATTPTPYKTPARRLEAVPTLFDLENDKHTVVSMFSGCGGMDFGLRGGFNVLGKRYKRLPFRIVWANDNSAAACKTYVHNLQSDIHCGDVWGCLDRLPKKADVVVGGFPCQDVSINGNRNLLNGDRTSLYKAMVEAVRRLNPLVFVAENVKGLLMQNEEQPLQTIVSEFAELGYNVSHKLYLAADYGVPQMRERIFIVGTSKRRRIRRFVHPEPTLTQDQWLTAKDAIGDLAHMEETLEFSHIWSRAAKSPEQGNRILTADRPGATIRAECHGNIQFHYEEPRRISMREAARIQSFPDNFRFKCKLRETERQVGNAVPPVLAWHMGRAIHDFLS
jgi:DNA (cytosine-5)-methyltransferase 1